VIALYRLCRQAGFAALLVIPVFGQGGPPFRTDDPGTPGDRHWEINIGLVGARNLSEGSYSTPDIDINYGLGDRIQLKYEVPLAVHETRKGAGGLAGGMGNSLLGMKYRFYEQKGRASTGDSDDRFSLSVYPQLALNNPTRAVARQIAEPGPQFLLPIEAAVRIGPVRIVAETGYWFTKKEIPDGWIRGVMAGHEFRNGMDLYLELYVEADVRAPAGEPNLRESTLGIGGRKAVTRQGSVLLMGMAGRSIVRVTADNGQPQWIAYVGMQFLLGRHGGGR
jgi:hypothetical protein